MYKSKLAVAIKHNGKILRETQDLVKLPFGSEFSVLVKNLNSRRAKFTLHIDGTDVLDGQEIIVNANSEVEMKRFIRNGNMDEGNAFKFIERIQAIEDGPRGVKVDDGVVRVEFWFEKEVPEIKVTHHHDVWWDDYRYPYRRSIWSLPFGGPYYGSVSGSSTDISNVSPKSSTQSIVRGMFSDSGTVTTASNASLSTNATTSINVSAQADVSTTNDAGITVPGSKVEQKFTAVYGFDPEAQSHVIVIRLVGKVGHVEVAAPVTVKSKQKCSTCSHVNKSNAKFCSQCGTSLELV